VRSTTARSTTGIPATSGYADLAREIRRLGLQRRQPGFYTLVLIANLVTLGGVVTAMAFLRDSWWVMLLAVPGSPEHRRGGLAERRQAWMLLASIRCRLACCPDVR
jgi:hypothetical protein